MAPPSREPLLLRSWPYAVLVLAVAAALPIARHPRHPEAPEARRELRERFESGIKHYFEVHPEASAAVGGAVLAALTGSIALHARAVHALALGQPVLGPGLPADVPWNLPDVARTAIAYLALQTVGALAVLRCLGPLEAARERSLAVLLTGTGNVLALGFVAALLASRGATLAAIGLGRLEGRAAAAVAGVAAAGYLMAWPAFVAASWVNEWAYRALSGEPPPFHPLHELLSGDASWPWRAVFYAVALAVAPLAEEVFFRGLLYRALKRVLPRGFAIALAAAAFAVVHQGFAAWLPIFVLGCALALVYERSGSLWGAVGLHALHNGLALLQAALLRGAAEGSP